mmetsp:Transcript_45707/g.129285  ORF Transcript_45707/g.129285 Transcript_45707/m.129285 type:complete len:231 (+) Transcript_45707:1411-2103(+)
MPPHAQHMDSVQSAPGFEQCVFTQAGSFFTGGTAMPLPGVRPPSAVQFHFSGFLSVKSGPAAQLSLQAAYLSFFLKHCMPAQAQHLDSVQSSPGSEQRVLTQGAASPAATRGGAPGVRPPSALHSQGWSFRSAGSGPPGAQSALQLAQCLFLLKHCMPGAVQQPVCAQLSPTSVHSDATQLATAPPEGMATPGVRSPSGLQLQGPLSLSVGSGPGAHSALHIAKPPSSFS